MSRLATLTATVLVALALTVTLAPAAAAQATSSADEFGTAWTSTSCAERGGTFTAGPPVACAGFIGDGASKAVDGDDPGDAMSGIQDRAIEWTPTVITIFGTILAFGFAMVLLALGVRKALSKLTMLVRKS